jgi:hypothetical protein
MLNTASSTADSRGAIRNFTQVLYYNKTVFDKAGIDLARNPPKTWEKLLELAKVAMEKGNVNKAEDFFGFDTSDACGCSSPCWPRTPTRSSKSRRQGRARVQREVRRRGRDVLEKMVDARSCPPAAQQRGEEIPGGELGHDSRVLHPDSPLEGQHHFELGAIPMPGSRRSPWPWGAT